MSEISQREAAAYHEAGHAVIALRLGWEINHEGVEIDERQYTGMRCRKFQHTTYAELLVALAGWNAEHKWHGRGVRRGEQEDDLRSTLAKARWPADPAIGTDGDDYTAFRRLLADDPDASEEILLARYRAYESAVIAMLNESDVWQNVVKIGRGLIERGKLSADDVFDLVTWMPTDDHHAQVFPWEAPAKFAANLL